MMKRLSYVFFVLISCMVFSCSKEVHGPERHGGLVSFSAPALEDTKAAFIESADGLAEGFSVYAQKFTTDQDRMLFMDNVMVYRKDDMTWGYDGEDYYWSPGAYHMFYAIYPYCDEDDGRYSFEPVQSGLLVAQKGGAHIETGVEKDVVDIVYGSCEFTSEPFSLDKAPESIKFQMRHAFSSVQFDVVNHSDYEIASVIGKIWGEAENGTMPGLYDKASSLTISATDARTVWEGRAVGDGRFDFTSVINLAKGKECTVFEEMVIPQNINTSEAGVKDRMYLHLKVDFKDVDTDPTFSVCLADIELSGQEALYKKTYLPGKRYKYTLNVTSQYVTCGVSLVDWDDDDMIDL